MEKMEKKKKIERGRERKKEREREREKKRERKREREWYVICELRCYRAKQRGSHRRTDKIG